MKVTAPRARSASTTAATESPSATNECTEMVAALVGRVVAATASHTFGVAAGSDLSFSQLRTLFVLHHWHRADPDGEHALHELAATAGLTVPTAGRAVDALTTAGLTSRREDPADRRVKRVRLTAGGRDMVETLCAARLDAVAGVVGALSGEQAAALVDALRPLLPAERPDGCAGRPR